MSAEYLRGLRDEFRKGTLMRIIDGYIQEVKRHARFGKTEHLIQFKEPTITMNEFSFSIQDVVDALKYVFPDSKIEYRDDIWVDKTPTTKERKCGIRIDWSI